MIQPALARTTSAASHYLCLRRSGTDNQGPSGIGPYRFMESLLVPVNTLWRHEPHGRATLLRSPAEIYSTGCERFGWSLALPGNASGSWKAFITSDLSRIGTMNAAAGSWKALTSNRLMRIGTMNRATWSTTKPPEGGTLTGREPDNAADHAERPPARVPRLRGKARFMGSLDDKRLASQVTRDVRSAPPIPQARETRQLPSCCKGSAR